MPFESSIVKIAALAAGVELKPHQLDYVQAAEQSPDGGELAFHGLGTGKTFSSIAAAESAGDPANVVVPAALRPNFKKQVERFANPKANVGYNVVSYDRAAKTEKPVESRPTLILDEVQRLRNQGRQYQGAMRLAQQADRRLLLSGTPLVNNPGDMASLVNLLHGRQMFTPGEFEKRYAGTRIQRPFLGLFGQAKVVPDVKRRKELLGLLEGRVHYAGDVTDTKPSTEIQDVPVEMSPLQDRLTRAMQNQLPFWARWRVRHNLPPSKKQATQLNAFLSGVRQVALSPHGFDRRLDPLQAFEQSPKMQESFGRLHTELQSNPNAKIAVYSNFIDAGLTPYAAKLESAGVPFVKFDGTMSDAARKQAVELYNGNKVRVVLLGPAGAEGISLMGTSQFHSLDPHWNQARTDQAQGRAVRLDSHTHLPFDERHVAIQRFLSEPRRSAVRRLLRLGPQVGSDRYLATRAAEKQQALDAFMDVLREAGTRQP